MSNDIRDVGWHADPFGRHSYRWWDGTKWSEKVRTERGGFGIDPAGIDFAPVAITESVPAEPIKDAVLVGCLVFLGLIAVFVVALTT